MTPDPRDADPLTVDDDMCPNCVTPWKCNGPHMPEPSSIDPRVPEPWRRPVGRGCSVVDIVLGLCLVALVVWMVLR